MKSGRRGFLRAAAGGLFGAAVLPRMITLAYGADSDTRNGGYSAGSFALELDGAFAGWLHGIQGGRLTSDVVTEKKDGTITKDTGAHKYEPITIICGGDMSPSFFEWLNATANGKPVPKSGAILSVDASQREVGRLAFSGALISEIQFPALDAASKEPVFMHIAFHPAETHMTAQPDGATGGQTVGDGTRGSLEKRWMAANFRLKIDGVEDACKSVNKIDAVTLRPRIVQSAGVSSGHTQMDAGHVPPATLVMTLAEASAGAFHRWYAATVNAGIGIAAGSRNGTLELLSPDLQEALFKLRFLDLTILKLALEPLDSRDLVRRSTATLACKQISFDRMPGPA